MFSWSKRRQQRAALQAAADAEPRTAGQPAAVDDGHSVAAELGAYFRSGTVASAA